MKNDLCIVGGCGHVGLPLGLAFADSGKKVALYDIDKKKIDAVNEAKLPFKEEGGEPALQKVIKNKKLFATNDVKAINEAQAIIMVIGTPVDEHLNPKVNDIITAVKEIEKYLRDDQLLILRSTLYPGVTEKVHAYLQRNNKKTLVAFCPERIAEGYALRELRELPQIISGCTKEAEQKAGELFKVLAKKVIPLRPKEAEIAKLYANVWRYINFATTNQFYMIAESNGLDFYKISQAMTEDYPRLKAFARPGLTAGPCLFKDTMQLSSFGDNNFFLGHAAMLVNEGLPDFIVEQIKKKHNLSTMTVGLLGMAFKADNDDTRESLSYKLKKKLVFESKEVLCHDPYVKNDPSLVGMEEIYKKADMIVVAAPHNVYKDEDWSNKILVDIWNFYGKGGQI